MLSNPSQNSTTWQHTAMHVLQQSAQARSWLDTEIAPCRILQKCSLVQTAKIMERDSQRQDLSKVKLSQAETNSSLESLREELHKLTQQASATEQQLVRLRRHYEQGVQERNDLGLQLIERNEEVCVCVSHCGQAVNPLPNHKKQLKGAETMYSSITPSIKSPI